MKCNDTSITGIDIAKDQRLTLDGRLCRVERVVDGQITLEDVLSRRLTVIDQTELVDKWTQGKICFLLDDERGGKLGAANDNLGRSFDSFPKPLQERALRSRTYVVSALEDMPDRLSDRRLGVVIAKVAETISDVCPPSPRTVRRWIAAWKLSGGDIRCFIPCDSAKGNRNPQIPLILADMIDEAIDTAYLRREAITIDTLATAVLKSVDEYNKDRLPLERLEIPSDETLRRAIGRRDPYRVAVAKHGKKAADAYFMPVFSIPRAAYPLHVVQIDHTRVDLLTYVRGRAVLRRAWLSIALDQFTRMIVGLHLGYDAPGYLCVMMLLRNLILPKTYVREKYPDIKADWPCFGLPTIILVDNGTEFHSKAFRDACLQLGIEIRYCEAGRPQQKASVERIFRTLNDQLFHQLPGTTFGNPIKRGDYDPKKRAMIDFDLLVEGLHQYVIDIYHQRFHRGLRDVPLAAWRNATKTHPVSLPPSVRDLVILTAKVASKPLHHYGIELNHLRYNSFELARLRPAKGHEKKFTVRYDPSDLSKLWVLDDALGIFLEVPSTDLEYTNGLSEYQHGVILRHAKEACGGGKVRRDQLRRIKSKLLDKLRIAEAKGEANTVNAVRYAGTQANSPHVDIRDTIRATPPSPDGFDDLYEGDSDDALIDDDVEFEEPSVAGGCDLVDATGEPEDDIDLEEWGRRYGQ